MIANCAGEGIRVPVGGDGDDKNDDPTAGWTSQSTLTGLNACTESAAVVVVVVVERRG